MWGYKSAQYRPEHTALVTYIRRTSTTIKAGVDSTLLESVPVSMLKNFDLNMVVRAQMKKFTD